MEDTVKTLVRPCILLIVMAVGSTALIAQTAVATDKGHFTSFKQKDGREVRAFVAGPADARAGVLFVHDYFGISNATKGAVERLGSMGYLAVAVDLYGGKSAMTHESAVKLMESMDSAAAAATLQACLDYLKRPGRKLATIGFSMGGQQALKGNLNDPNSVSATVIVYGFGFDAIETKELQRLGSPVLVVSGAAPLLL
jgi:carboxymethylenebutenolidase